MDVIINGKKYVKDGEQKFVETCSRCDNIDWFISEVERLIAIRQSYLDRDSDIDLLKIQNSMAIEVLREVLDRANEILKPITSE